MEYQGHRVVYGSKILDHFRNPRNIGVAPHFNKVYLEQNNRWLVRILLTLQVEKGVIQEAKFKAQSCVTTVACLSALTEMVRGKRIEDAVSITPEQVSEYLDTVPPEKMYCCELAVNTLRHALNNTKERQQ